MLITQISPAIASELTGLVSAIFNGIPDDPREGNVAVLLFGPDSPHREKVIEIMSADPNYLGLADDQPFGELGGITFRFRPIHIHTDLD